MYEMWNRKVNSESDEVRMSVQIRELCGWRSKCGCTDIPQKTMQISSKIYSVICLERN